MMHANWTRMACVTVRCLPAVRSQSVSLLRGCHFTGELASDPPYTAHSGGPAGQMHPDSLIFEGPAPPLPALHALLVCAARGEETRARLLPTPPNSHAPGASRAPLHRAQRLRWGARRPRPPCASYRPLCLLPPTRVGRLGQLCQARWTGLASGSAHRACRAAQQQLGARAARSLRPLLPPKAGEERPPGVPPPAPPVADGLAGRVPCPRCHPPFVYHTRCVPLILGLVANQHCSSTVGPRSFPPTTLDRFTLPTDPFSLGLLRSFPFVCATPSPRASCGLPQHLPLELRTSRRGVPAADGG